ncbi:MAG: DUF4126 domain-containing protein [Gammaproteobacteria bacterium]|nr:DUF4126 domain-containing protein [Gammaproteobacteria bacterium]MCK5498488.1 DUF4126 domain-containing protein [Gammaproteobacteria bacterium]
MDTISIIALTMGTAWASGINLYATIFMLGYLGSTGNIDLPPDLMVVTDPLVMTSAGLMYCVEFFADKTPGVDTAWDALHTFIRIPLGAVLAMGAVGDMTPAVELAAFIVGGSLAGATHATKAGSRIVINSSPEPVTNWTASIGEDLLVIAGLWTALNHPVAFLIFITIFIGLMIWLLPKIWRGIKRIFNSIRNFFSGDLRNEVSETGNEIISHTDH